MPQTEVFDYWLQRTAVYGLAFVFTAGILFGFLWVCAILVRILSARLPKWFDDQEETNLAVRNGMQALVSNSRVIHDRTYNTQRGLRGIVQAGRKFVNKHKERLGIGSDVVVLLDQADDQLRNGDDDDER